MIEVLCGMIASGKSTYARRRADEGAVVVCHDDLTQMLHASYRYEAGYRTFYRIAEEAIAQAAAGSGLDVIIDRTHLTRESRRRWIDFANELGLGATMKAVVFPIEPACWHADRRFKCDPRGRSYEEWLGVAVHHEVQAQAEPLSICPSEGFNQVVLMGPPGSKHPICNLPPHPTTDAWPKATRVGLSSELVEHMQRRGGSTKGSTLRDIGSTKGSTKTPGMK